MSVILRTSPPTARLRSLSEICKWKIRDSILSGGNLKTAVNKLPIPKHLQDFLTARGFEKPRFTFLARASEEGTGEEKEEKLEPDYSEEPRPKPSSFPAKGRYYEDDYYY